MLPHGILKFFVWLLMAFCLDRFTSKMAEWTVDYDYKHNSEMGNFVYWFVYAFPAMLGFILATGIIVTF